MNGASRLKRLALRSSMLLVCLCLGFQRLKQLLNGVHLDENRRTEVLMLHGLQDKYGHDPVLPGNKTNDDIHTSIDAQDTTTRPQRRRRRRFKTRRNQTSEHQVTELTPTQLKVPLPIFVPSLPKSGTTSIHEYFLCGGQKSAHHVYKIDGKVQNKIGRCVKSNINQSMPPFDECGDYDIWTDTGFVAPFYHKGASKTNTAVKVPCFYPLIEALDEVYEAYPNATMLFVVRDEKDWLNSIQEYHEGFIMNVWKQCKTKGFPNENATPDDFGKFYQWHQQLIRDFARSHPTMTYLEVPLEAENTGSVLEDHIGISKQCWGHHNRFRRKRRKTPK
jgi:Sulfotransferase domain